MKQFKTFNEFLLETKTELTNEQVSWCNRYLTRWSVDENGYVNVNDEVILPVLLIEKFPIKFGKTKSFSCSKCESLLSLEGVPYECNGYFSCSGCKSLTTLIGSPQKVHLSFYCSDCTSLVTLEGVSQEIDGNFVCNNCASLTTLKEVSKIGGLIFCNNCDKLPEEEVELVKDKELFQKWLKSGLPVEEFLKKARGMIHGKNFGI